jgi:hypothetical protein
VGLENCECVKREWRMGDDKADGNPNTNISTETVWKKSSLVKSSRVGTYS